MGADAFVFAGGMYCVALAVFHLFFWKIFNWKQDLRKLSYVNRAIMQVLNLRLTFVFLIFAYIAFFHSEELLATNLGRVLLFLIAISWFMRAVEQLIFFQRNKVSLIFFAIFLVGGLLYIFPLIG